MKKSTAPAEPVAFALVESYGTLVVPVDVLPLLAGMARFSRDYKDGKYVYNWSKEQTVSFTLISAEEVNAIKVAGKLEGTAT